MSKFPIMSFRWIFQLLNKLWVFFSYLCNKQFRKVLQYQPVKYDLYPLSPGELHKCFSCLLRWLDGKNFPAFIPVSRHRLGLVQRKTLVLDLDETLIHSHHDGLPRNPSIKPGTPHDFTVSYTAREKSIFHSFSNKKKNLWRCFVRKEEEKWDERNRRVKLSLYVRAGTR